MEVAFVYLPAAVFFYLPWFRRGSLKSKLPVLMVALLSTAAILAAGFFHAVESEGGLNVDRQYRTPSGAIDYSRGSPSYETVSRTSYNGVFSGYYTVKHDLESKKKARSFSPSSFIANGLMVLYVALLPVILLGGLLARRRGRGVTTPEKLTRKRFVSFISQHRWRVIGGAILTLGLALVALNLVGWPLAKSPKTNQTQPTLLSDDDMSAQSREQKEEFDNLGIVAHVPRYDPSKLRRRGGHASNLEGLVITYENSKGSSSLFKISQKKTTEPLSQACNYRKKVWSTSHDCGRIGVTASGREVYALTYAHIPGEIQEAYAEIGGALVTVHNDPGPTVDGYSAKATQDEIIKLIDSLQPASYEELVKQRVLIERRKSKS